MFFIVFEGSEGVGKTTQIDLLSKKLATSRVPFVKTREPGGTPFAEKLRNLLKSPEEGDILPLSELLLIACARYEHIEKIVRPALERKQMVICDRFLDSTYVYQHFLHGVPKQEIDAVMSLVLGDLYPHLTIILDGVSRREKKEAELDRFDSLPQEKLLDIGTFYRTIFSEKLVYPQGRVPKRSLISALGTPEEVHNEICVTIKAELGLAL